MELIESTHTRVCISKTNKRRDQLKLMAKEFPARENGETSLNTWTQHHPMFVNYFQVYRNALMVIRE